MSTTTSCKSIKLFSTINLLILINLISYAKSQPNICTNNGGYTNNSTYDVNLNALTSTLSSNIGQNVYYAASISTLTTNETINALALCRGDQTPEQCNTCVQSGAPQLVNLCRNQRQGVVWFDNCLLRYSNAPLHQPSNIQFVLSSGYKAPNRDQFKSDRDQLLEDLGQLAANGSSQLKVGAGRRATSAVGSESQAIYALVQCTPDMSTEDCLRCFAEATESIHLCCDAETGVRLLKPDCTVQYEIRSFYNETQLSERGVLLS